MKGLYEITVETSLFMNITVETNLFVNITVETNWCSLTWTYRLNPHIRRGFMHARRHGDIEGGRLSAVRGARGAGPPPLIKIKWLTCCAL
jgi:hypothetical protein